MGQSDPLPLVPPTYHWLLRLPPHAWSQIHLYLDYVDILNLSSLSSEFLAEGVEKYLPWAVRHQVVAKIDAVSDPTTHSACYLCFRIKRIEEFQQPYTMATYARVLQRNEYNGQRIFEVVSELSPGQTSNIVQPPSLPVSPVGMGMGVGMNPFLFGAPVSPSVHAGLNIPIGVGGNIGSSAVAGSSSVGHVHRKWRPQAPGAEVGQIESLRTYCIQCALETHLAIAGDMIEPRMGPKLWVCACQVARSRDNGQRCPTCGMSAVYRDAVIR